jgi:pentapeptide MXKDX repeat protein
MRKTTQILALTRTLAVAVACAGVAGLALPGAAFAQSSVKEDIKEKGREMKSDAKSAKSEIKRDAKKTWNGAKSGTKKAGREVKQGAREAKESVKEKVN